MYHDSAVLTESIPRSEAFLETIRRAGETVTFPAKTVFLTPGVAFDGVYYIERGHTRHYMVSMDGTEKILYSLSDGWFFREAPALLGEPTGLYSRTDTETTLVRIGTKENRRLMDESPLYRDALFDSLARKTLMLRHEVEYLSMNSCKDRLKRLFCSAADTEHPIDKAWYPLTTRYTQYDLGIIIGAARVTVNKLVNELCGEGFLRVLNRCMQVNIEQYNQFVRWMPLRGCTE